MKILPSKMCYSFLIKIFFLPRAPYREIFSYREPLPESRIQEPIPCPGTPTRVPYIGIDPLPGYPYPSTVYRNRSPARVPLPEYRIQEPFPCPGTPTRVPYIGIDPLPGSPYIGKFSNFCHNFKCKNGQFIFYHFSLYCF